MTGGIQINGSTLPEAEYSSDFNWLHHYPKGVDWRAHYDAKPVYAMLDDAAKHYPTSVCTNFLGKKTTYSEIHDQVNRAAAGLQHHGVAPGVKVGLLLPNCPTFIVYYFAILKLGATVVNYNPLYSNEELRFQVANSETEFMVTLDLKIMFDKVEALIAEGTLKKALVCSFAPLLPDVQSLFFRLLKQSKLSRPSKSAVRDRLIFEDDLIANDGIFTQPHINPSSDVAVLQYSGGTTGSPKGAMLTHANLYINVHQIMDWSGEFANSQQRVLAVLPFFHVFAMTVVMNFSVATASEIILMPRFDLDQALKLIHQTKPTMMPGVPTLFNAIVHHPKIKSFDLSSITYCISGGAALPLDVKRRFESLTGAALVEGYGLSETSPVVSVNPMRGSGKDNSIGQPIPQTIISLRDLDNPAKEVPIGEKGEVCIAGPQVMKGYWKAPEETQKAFVGEFLRTGDVGIMDEEGFFFIVDRIKDLIICSGYNVYPRRIEEVLFEHPDVEEAAVIGIADDYRGEAPKAFVKLKSGATTTQDDLIAHMKPKLSKIEMPAEIEFREELPKTMVGKTSKKELKAEEQAKRKPLN